MRNFKASLMCAALSALSTLLWQTAMSSPLSQETSHLSEIPLEVVETSEMDPERGLYITDQEVVHITGQRISNPNGNCVTVNAGKKVVIENSYIGPCGGMGVVVSGSADVQVRNNYIKQTTTGVYILSSSAVQVFGNTMKNMLGPRPKGSIVQFDKVSGAGNRIFHNVGLNIEGQSSTFDIISLYQSKGTSASPVLVTENYLLGGGPSTVGGGIMLGDSGGTYQRAANNIVINPGQYGVAVSGGSNMALIDNRVYSQKRSMSNVAVYAWAQAGVSCSGVEISYNAVAWLNKNGVSNPFWDGGNCGTIKQVGNNFNDTFRTPPIPSHWGPDWPTPSDF